MPKFKLTNYLLFRRRIALAYGFIFIVLASLLAVALYIPGGITHAEQASVVHATTDNLISVNAPYYWLQKTSIHYLGLTTLAIKLPSIVIGALLGVSLFFLLRRWTSLTIAVFGALIIFTSTTFLSIVGTGSPVILYLLYPALLLFLGTGVLVRGKGVPIYTVLLLVAISLALLTPSMGYLLLLAVVIALFNPHVRYGFRRLPLYGSIPLVLGFLIALTPVGYLVLRDPASLATILAVPSSLSLAGVGHNATTLLISYGRFLHPGIMQAMPAPFVGLATAGLAVLGLYRTIRGAYTARAQFILGWGGVALVIALIDPGFGVLLYLPVVLLATIGLAQLAGIWYRTFPFNPYARITALVPIGVLIAGIVIGSSLRYVNTTLYAAGSTTIYSHDLQLLNHYLATTSDTGITLNVSAKDTAFYRQLHSPKVSSVVSGSQPAANSVFITTSPLDSSQVPVRIITDSRRVHADRFYIYR